MSTNVSPSYLSSLVPQSVDHASSYNLSNSHNLRHIATRTNLYYNSFLPSVIRDWNELPVVVRQLDSVCSFKNYLNRDFTPVPKYYLTGNRKSQILHTRLRTNCSSLNNDLFLKNISESPLCSCGSIENTQHFFLRCPRYNEHRTLLFNEVSKHQPVSLNLLLYGSSSLSYETIVAIFQIVHKYISDTKRFT